MEGIFDKRWLQTKMYFILENYEMINKPNLWKGQMKTFIQEC